MSPTPKLYLDAGASPDGLLWRSIGMLGEPLGDQGTEGLFHSFGVQGNPEVFSFGEELNHYSFFLLIMFFAYLSALISCS